jgi:intracellular septation protein
MQTLIELAPLIAFFAAYKFAGIYVATAVLMGAMLLLLGWDWLSKRAIPKMHLISAILVWVFGTVTLILHDVRFIQWKATVDSHRADCLRREKAPAAVCRGGCVRGLRLRQ